MKNPLTPARERLVRILEELHPGQGCDNLSLISGIEEIIDAKLDAHAGGATVSETPCEKGAGGGGAKP